MASRASCTHDRDHLLFRKTPLAHRSLRIGSQSLNLSMGRKSGSRSVDWFQGVWVQDWVQPKWIVRRGNPLHVCPRSQRPPVSQLKCSYRETTEAAMAHPTSKPKQPKWILSLCREMQTSIGL